MSVEILLGKSKSGKSKYIYECINKDIKEGKSVILFVPSQIRLLTEETYMKELNLNGIIGVNITTIGAYIEENLKALNLHFDENRLTKTEKRILLFKTLRENEDVLNLFSKAKNKQGFLSILYMYMDILRKENVNIKELRNVELTDKILKEKLNEILNIYEKYIENISGKFIDNIDEIDIYIQNIDKTKLDETKIYFDGYNNFTNSELKLIEAFIKQKIDIKFALTTDITGLNDIENSADIFEVSNKTYNRLISICKKNNIDVENNLFLEDFSSSTKELIYLKENLFSKDICEKLEPKNSVIVEVKNNIYKEIEDIAISISKKIREGYKFTDFVIYTTNVEKYNNIIKRTFNKYNIPFFIDDKKVIKDFKLTLYILKLLNLSSNGLTYENIIEILKLKLNDIDENRLYELENYVYEFGLNKYLITKELKENNDNLKNTIYDLKELNNLRNKILEIFAPLLELKTEKKDVKEIINFIYSHLLENNVFLNYEKNILTNKEIDKEYINSTSFYEEQVWGKIAEILNSIYKVYNNKKLTLNEFYEIFNEETKNVNIKSIPPTIDKVQIIDINVQKAGVSKIGFFIGVNENEFPKKIDEDLLFSDFDLQKLENKNIEFKESSLSKLNMQLYNIYEAISNIKEKLYISILAADVNGKALRKSSLVTSIKQVLDIKILGNSVNDDLKLEDIYSKEELFTYFVNNIKENDIDKLSFEKLLELTNIYNYLLKDEKYASVLKYVKNDNNLSENSINLIFGKDIVTSISKLELFKKCPFSYLLKYSLNIEKREEYEITTLDTGSFMHEVLDKFSKYLLEKNIYWQSIIDENEMLKKEYEDILVKIINDIINKIFKKHKENIRFNMLKIRLINTMKNVIIVIAKSFNQSEFVPYGYEIEFKDGSLFAPITVDISDGRKLKLIGKIDRVDILKLEDKSYVRVVDYKSSSRTLDIDSIKEGLSLQLISYLRAFIKTLNNKENVTVLPAACVYFNLSNNLISLSTYSDDEEKVKAEIIKALRMKGLFLQDVNIIEKMDKKLDDKSNRMLDVAKSSLNKESKKVLSKDNFVKLCEDTDKLLQDIGKEVLSGVVKIAPNKKADFCKYCSYMNICRKNSSL